MRLTNKQLRTIVESVLSEQAVRKVDEHFYAANLHDLLGFAKAYAKLGWAVQEQFEKLLQNTDEGVSPVPWR